MNNDPITKDHREAMAGSLSAEEIAKLRTDQSEIVKAFVAKYGCEPFDVGVDIRNLGNGRMTWTVRKLSKAEREVKIQQMLAKDVRAMSDATKRTVVYIAGNRRWWQKLLWPLNPICVFLSVKGAAAAGGGAAIGVEVRP